MKSSSAIHAKIKHPLRWTAGIFIFIFGLVGFLLWKPGLERPFERHVPIEKIVWTASPDYEVFYGPGTPPSLAVAKYLRGLHEKGYYPGELDDFPEEPIFIMPSSMSDSADADEPFIVSPFTQEVGRRLRQEHQRKLKR